MKIALLFGLALLFEWLMLVGWMLQVLPLVELRRRSRQGQITSRRLANLASFEPATRSFLWLIGTALAIGMLVVASQFSYWLAVAVAIGISLDVVIKPIYIDPESRLGSLAGWLAVGLVPIVSRLQPLFKFLPQPKASSKHTGVFETEDLIRLLDRQGRQAGNRIDRQDINAAKAGLGFVDKKVSDLAMPFNKVRLVLPDESIGPHLMDELYLGGHSVFPVGKKVGKKLPPELVGVVYLNDLVASSLRGNVSSVMVRGINRVDQTQTLTQALENFLKNHATLLVVADERDESVGLLWLEDILSLLLGRKISAGSDNPADADAREKMVE